MDLLLFLLSAVNIWKQNWGFKTEIILNINRYHAWSSQKQN